MKSIFVEIKGESPLLMHNPAQLLNQNSETMVSKNKKKVVASEQAEINAYRTKQGELYIPSQAVFSAMMVAGRDFKIKTKYVSNILGGSIRIEPEFILLGTKEYEIYSAPVVIQRAHVIRHRPILRKWKASFQLIYDDDWIPNGETILKQVLETAGKRAGLLDYRPAKKGPYGTFSISKWEGKE